MHPLYHPQILTLFLDFQIPIFLISFFQGREYFYWKQILEMITLNTKFFHQRSTAPPFLLDLSPSPSFPTYNFIALDNPFRALHSSPAGCSSFSALADTSSSRSFVPRDLTLRVRRQLLFHFFIYLSLLPRSSPSLRLGRCVGGGEPRAYGRPHPRRLWRSGTC